MAGKNSSTFSLIDLFSGAGGLTQGFVTATNRRSQFAPIAAVELDPFAAATYASNFGPHVFQGDISDWLGIGVPKADVVIGGPPCQGFSALGKRDPADIRNKLWARYAEVVEQAHPLYFVLENVPPFLKSDQFEDLRKLTGRGRALAHYTFDESVTEVVVASDYGAAQKRRRAVVIGRRRDLPPVDVIALRTPHRTVRDVIGQVDFEVSETDLPGRVCDVQVANRTITTPGEFTTAELHVTRAFTKLSRDRYRAIPPGGNRKNLPPRLQARCWLDHDNGSHDVMGRLHWDRPSVTIRTEFWKPEKGRYLHPEAHRPITHMEAALLQGFPADFKWCGSKSAIGRQIGNAVPVELARTLAWAVLEALNSGGARPGGAG